MWWELWHALGCQDGYKPPLLRSCYLMSKFSRMLVDQKLACRRCDNDMSLSAETILESAAFLQTLGLSSYMEGMAVPMDLG